MTDQANSKPALIYSYSVALDACKRYGLVFDARVAAVADPVFAGANLTQDQVDKGLILYCSIMAWMWDRKNYPLWTRLRIAAYWLGLGKRIKSDVK